MALQATATRPEAWGWHLLGPINPLVVIAKNRPGGPFVAVGVIYMLGIGPLFDIFLGKSICYRPARESGRPFEVMLFVRARDMSVDCWVYACTTCTWWGVAVDCARCCSEYGY
jgi:hypothetical protein